MCGIAGILSTNPSVRHILERMLEIQAHRGPDHLGIWQNDFVFLGHNRLSIIDLSERGNQPMVSTNGRYVLVYNGEIYNYREVKKSLKHTLWHSDGDSEVVLQAFVELGPACLNLFNGMFALAIYDIEENSLFMARDRLGIKPLYYLTNGTEIVFASELRTILHSGFSKKTTNLGAISQFLRFQWIQSPETIISDIFVMKPGTYCKWENGSITHHTWWNLEDYIGQRESVTASESVEVIRDLLTKSVSRRLISDVPLGVFLSGGIDSSILTALSASQSNQTIQTFTIGFEESEFDESAVAERFAKLNGTIHRTLKLPASELIRNIAEIHSQFDTPSADGVNTNIISKLVKQQGITVVLGGIGGDELFGGYPVFQKLPQLQNIPLIWKFPQEFRNAIAYGIKPFITQPKLLDVLRGKGNTTQELYPLFRQIFSNNDVNTILHLDTRLEKVHFPFEFPGSPIDKFSFSAVSYAELEGYTQHILLKDADMCSMAHAVELRVPFLDHELVEYVLSLPDNVKIADKPKGLLTKTFRNELTSEILSNKKRGFTFPWDKWMRHELKEYVQDNLQSLGNNDLFNRSEIEALNSRFYNSRNDAQWYKIWNLVSLSVYFQDNKITN